MMRVERERIVWKYSELRTLGYAGDDTALAEETVENDQEIHWTDRQISDEIRHASKNE